MSNADATLMSYICDMLAWYPDHLSHHMVKAYSHKWDDELEAKQLLCAYKRYWKQHSPSDTTTVITMAKIMKTSQLRSDIMAGYYLETSAKTVQARQKRSERTGSVRK